MPFLSAVACCRALPVLKLVTLDLRQFAVKVGELDLYLTSHR